MTLKDLYGKIKGRRFINNNGFMYFITFILAIIIAAAMISLYVLILQLLWNWIAPILGLVKLGFLEIGGLVLFIKLLNVSITINTKRTYNEARYK